MIRAHRQPHTVAAGWLLVFAWLGAMPGFLPTLFAAVAWLEGSHRVEVRGDREGVSVVLAHGGSTHGLPHACIHEHGWFAKVLAVCTSEENGEPDHVAMFHSAGAGLREDSAPKLNDEVASEPFPPAALVVTRLPQPPVLAVRRWVRGAPPDGPPAHFPGKNSTLLLI